MGGRWLLPQGAIAACRIHARIAGFTDELTYARLTIVMQEFVYNGFQMIVLNAHQRGFTTGSCRGATFWNDSERLRNESSGNLGQWAEISSGILARLTNWRIIVNGEGWLSDHGHHLIN
jgi:hypothetical protein